MGLAEEFDAIGSHGPVKRKKKSSGIHIKKSHAGELHADLGVAKDAPIPAVKLAAAARSSDPAERKRAVFAENAKQWHHG